MAAHYYLLSTLPALRFASPPPLSFADYAEACLRLAGEDGPVAAGLSLTPPPGAGEDQGLGLFCSFARRETALRNALARLRAGKRGLDPGLWLRPLDDPALEAEAGREAQLIFSLADPLEAEFALERGRWSWIAGRTALDSFGRDALLGYGLELLILERLSRLKAEAGAELFGRLYADVLSAAGAAAGAVGDGEA